MGPRCQNGPKKVPILLPSPKFLILPSDDAEKGRHICSSQGTAMTIWTYTMHVSCTYLWYSLALSYLLIYFELSNVATTRFLLLLHFFFFLFMKITTKAPERSKNGPKKVPILPKILSPKSHILYYSACIMGWVGGSLSRVRKLSAVEIVWADVYLYIICTLYIKMGWVGRQPE